MWQDARENSGCTQRDDASFAGQGHAVLRSKQLGDMYVQVVVETPQNSRNGKRELLIEFQNYRRARPILSPPASLPGQGVFWTGRVGLMVLTLGP